jgi:peptidoglycan/xylan/chitin deacetylase (PgdA/CDA1 family)
VNNEREQKSMTYEPPVRNRLLQLWVATSIILAVCSPAHANDVALTFDDVPVFGKFVPAAVDAEITAKLLAGLKKYHWPATGFVNEIQLEGADKPARIALLSMWLDAGMDLGNHSYSHLSLTNTPVETYIADVARGETVTQSLLAMRGRTEHWYRHPYLETGTTIEIRRKFESWLSEHGYRVAPVSMENSDWAFAGPYDEALAHGELAAARHIQQEYLEYTERIISWYQAAAHDLLGREPAFIFLLHASRMNADSIDALAVIFHRQRLHPITLDQAITDPAYQIADDYAGPNGDQWLTRWALTLNKALPYGKLPVLPADISAPAFKPQPAPTIVLPVLP